MRTEGRGEGAPEEHLPLDPLQAAHGGRDLEEARAEARGDDRREPLLRRGEHRRRRSGNTLSRPVAVGISERCLAAAARLRSLRAQEHTGRRSARSLYPPRQIKYKNAPGGPLWRC